MFEVLMLHVGVIDGNFGLAIDLFVGEEDGLNPCFDFLLNRD